MTATTDRPARDTGGWRIVRYWPAFTLGMLALIAQAILAREAMSAAAGHELMFGVMLTGWLAGQALCLTAVWRTARKFSISAALLVCGALIPVSFILLRWTVVALMPTDGTLPSLSAIAPLVLLSTIPASLGLAIAFAAIYHATHRRDGAKALRLVYAAETAGYLAGGLVWTFLLAGKVQHAQLICALPALIACVLIYTSWPLLRYWRIAPLLIAPLIAGLLLHSFMQTYLSPALPQGLDPVSRQDGRIASWQVAEYGGEYSFYRNGRFFAATGQPEVAAERILLPLSQVLESSGTTARTTGDADETSALLDSGESVKPPPVKVLYIGLRWPGVDGAVAGGDSVSVTWLENDELYSRLYGRYAGGEQAQPARGSPLSMISSREYDLIVLNLGSPSSPDVEWAYSRGFFEFCRDHLPPAGVLALSLDAEENYNSPALKSLHQRVQADLGDVYNNLGVTPPIPVWYFAGNGDAALTLDPAEIEGRLAAYGLSAPSLSRWVLMDRLAPERAASWQLDDAALDGSASPLSLAGLRLELSASDPALAQALFRLGNSYFTLFVILAALVLLPSLLIKQSARDFGLSRSIATAYLAGFTCLAGEIVLAWKLQALTGQLYLLVALLTAVVLGGLFIGVVLTGSTKFLARADKLLLVLALALILILAHWGGFSSLSLAALWVLAILQSVGCGVALGNALADPHTASAKLYTADLLGSALAALFVGTLGLLILGAQPCLFLLLFAWLFMPRAMKPSDSIACIMTH